MFGDKFLRKDMNISYNQESFYLLPTIEMSHTNKYFEISFYFLRLHIYWCYSIYDSTKDEP